MFIVIFLRVHHAAAHHHSRSHPHSHFRSDAHFHYRSRSYFYPQSHFHSHRFIMYTFQLKDK